MVRKIFVISLAVLTICSCVLFGYINNNKVHAKNSVQKYIKDNYDLIATKIDIRFSIDGLDYARVSTTKWPFEFDVFINSKYEADGDMYIDALIEYVVEENIRNSVFTLSNDLDIMVVLENRLTNNYKDIKYEEIISYLQNGFDIPLQYYIVIDNINWDSEIDYSIFKEITDKFNPTQIKFNYTNKNTVKIQDSDFLSINSSEDIKSK